MKHQWMMILGCVLPLVLIFALPAMRISGPIIVGIIVLLMFACHLMMIFGHEEQSHEEEEHHRESPEQHAE